MTVIDKELLEKLLPYKLKIMPNMEGSITWVHCVIRTQVSPLKAMYSREIRYGWLDSDKNGPYISLESAINSCMRELLTKMLITP